MNSLLSNNRIPILLLALLLASGLYSQPLTFNEVAQSQGITYSFPPCDFAGGVSFTDFDGDGRDDLTFGSCNGEEFWVMRNQGGGFLRISDPAWGTDTARSRCLVWVDYDNDGDKDLYVSNEIGQIKLYRQNSPFSFSDVSQAAGLPDTTLYSYHACWGDYDRDGWLDLYVVIRNAINLTDSPNRMYHNNGDGTFSDMTGQVGCEDSTGLGFAAVFFDYNNDQWPDLYVANDKTWSINRLYENNGNGTFSDVTDSSTTGFPMDGMGIAVGDYDRNGYEDLYVTNSPGADGNILLHNNGDGTFSHMADSLNLQVQEVGWGAQFVDLDNDGWQDLIVANGSMGVAQFPANSVFYNLGGTSFNEDLTSTLATDTALSFGNAVGDFNGDGFYDVAVMNGAPSTFQLYQNGANGNAWLKISMEGVVSNRDAVGTRVEVWSGGDSYFQEQHCGVGFGSQNADRMILGFGANPAVDSLVFHWPSGIKNRLENIPLNSSIHVVEDSTSLLITAYEAPIGSEGLMLNCSPNPFQNKLRLHWELLSHQSVGEVRILNALGQMIHREELEENGRSDLELTIPRGVYFVRLISGQRSITRRIVKL